MTPFTDTTIFFWNWLVFLFFVLFVTCVFTDWLIVCVCVCVYRISSGGVCSIRKNYGRTWSRWPMKTTWSLPPSSQSEYAHLWLVCGQLCLQQRPSVALRQSEYACFWLSCVDSCASSKGGLLPSSQSVCSLLVCGELSGQGASCFKRCLCEKVILCLGRCLCEIQTHKLLKRMLL